MTERPGGSDVGRTETQAVWNEDLKSWSVSGFKWFSSATDADVTMLLARTHDPTAPGTMRDGSKGLSLYLARVRDDQGKLNGVRIHRLKDKVGTKALPTAELELDGMIAQQVGRTYRGVKNISAILNITRIYCGMNCTSSMQRFVLMVKEYARRREVSSGHTSFYTHLNKKNRAPIDHNHYSAGLWCTFEGPAFAPGYFGQHGAPVPCYRPVHFLLCGYVGQN